MRTYTLALVLCALLVRAAVALPGDLTEDNPGQFLTIRVERLPDAASVAVCDLGPGLVGLPLQRQGDLWSGSFALLPNLVSEATNPRVRCYAPQGVEQSTKGSAIEMASSTFDNSGLATVLAEPNVRFVFDHNVVASSIRLLTGDSALAPEIQGNTFALPPGVVPANVRGISAQSKDGTTMVVQPDWTPQQDVATVEEAL